MSAKRDITLVRWLSGTVRVFATACVVCFGSTAALADYIRLSSGERLRVTKVTVQDGLYVCRHPVLGVITISAKDVIEHIIENESPEPVTVPNEPSASPTQARLKADESREVAAPPVAIQPPSGDFSPPMVQSDADARQKARAAAIAEADRRLDEEKAAKDLKKSLNTASFFTGWKGTVEAGGSGTDGNTETLNLRAGLGLSRTAELLRTRLDASYLYSTEDGFKSQSRGEANAINDWLLRESPWGLFAKGKAEYDEFQDWDWRLSAFAGPSYAFWESPVSTLRGRLGAGATREIGSTRNEVIPEGLAGLEFQYQFTPRQSMFAEGEYLPSLSDFPEYRFNIKAGYTFLVDPRSNLRLRLGIEDRYNSNPGPGFKSSDIEYFGLLGLEF